MRAVLDANVVISGIFWGGPPQQILKRWLEGKLTELSEFVEPQQVSVICRDAGDQKYLEAAAGGRVQALVSGDKDLAVLKMIEGIPILSPRAFLLGHKT